MLGEWQCSVEVLVAHFGDLAVFTKRSLDRTEVKLGSGTGNSSTLIYPLESLEFKDQCVEAMECFASFHCPLHKFHGVIC